MIYILCGSLLLFIGILFLIHPATSPSKIYGYVTRLATTNQASFKYAQKVAGITNVVVGIIQLALGFLINSFKLDNLFILWLLTLPVFILMMFIVTESKLEKFLKARNELPGDYQKLDNQKHEYQKGFKDK